MALNLKQQTAAEFAARFWARVAEAQTGGNQIRRHFLVWWVWDRIQRGDLTSDQVRQSFNAAFGKSLTTAQWNSYVTAKLIPMKDRYLALLAEVDL